nr:long-chain fatty acid transport protein-like [Nerophis lumbriciformis]
MSTLAYVLIEGLRRLGLEGSDWAKKQCGTIRSQLLKIGAVVIRNTRRIKVHLSRAHPCRSGFQLAERSATGLGRAFSGESAIGDDASIIASNPAGMVFLDDREVSAGLSAILGHVNVSGSSPIGPVSDNPLPDTYVPFFYAAQRLNDKFSFGVATFTTYGLETDYSNSFSAGASTDLSQLISVNFNPSLSYKVNDQLSIGFGINALYADGNITSVIPGSGANLFNLEGDDFGFGYNIGILYQVNENTRFGLHYRSSIDLNINGTADLGAPLGGAVVPATLDVELPDIIEFSAYHRASQKWAFHGDILWTNWSKFRELAPKTGLPIDALLAVPQNYEDTFRLSVGATYYHNETWTFRAGVAFDEGAANNEDRTLRIPDADRIWASIGLTYKINDNYNLDIGYTRLFGDDVPVFETDSGGTTLFDGSAGGDVDLIAIGISGTL